MQKQKQKRKDEPLSQQIERDTSRLDIDPLEKLNKRMNTMYAIIWILLSSVFLLTLVFILMRFF